MGVLPRWRGGVSAPRSRLPPVCLTGVDMPPVSVRITQNLGDKLGSSCAGSYLIGVGGTPDPMANVIDIEGLSCWDIVT
jgi:hypothetical protein